jgi:ankyrin repeat protein
MPIRCKFHRISVRFFNSVEKSTDVINAQDRKGSTALHCALLNESKIAVERLLKDVRVDVQVKNKNDETAASLLA